MHVFRILSSKKSYIAFYTVEAIVFLSVPFFLYFLHTGFVMFKVVYETVCYVKTWLSS